MTLCVYLYPLCGCRECCLLLDASMYALVHLNKLRYIWYCYVLLLYFGLSVFFAKEERILLTGGSVKLLAATIHTLFGLTGT
jgi:hypothetical protein